MRRRRHRRGERRICRGAGGGTVVNAKIAATGVVRVVNANATKYRDVFPLALTLTQTTGAENFASWQVVINGVPQRCWLKYENGQLLACPMGLSVIVR